MLVNMNLTASFLLKCMKRSFLIAALFIAMLSNTSLAKTSTELLGQAIQINNSISDNLPIEQRLEKYENIERIVNDIINEFSGTDEAINLISGQTVGNFNYKSVQNTYIATLTEYFDKVCVVAPNFECIAFISLDQGVKNCSSANNFDTLELGHKNLLNALNIFVSQESKPEYQSLALNSYRSCLASSKTTTTKYVSDYFSSKLIPTFLQLGKIDNAKAIIQMMEDPYLKFSAVLDLTKHSKKPITLDYLNRMDQFVKEKMDARRTAQERAIYPPAKNLSSLKLSILRLTQADYDIHPNELTERLLYPDKGRVAENIQVYGHHKMCDSEAYNEMYFDLIVEYIDALNTRLENQKGLYESSTYSGTRASEVFRIIDRHIIFYRHLEKLNCDNNLDIAARTYLEIRTFDKEKAEEFLEYAKLVDYNYKDMVEFLFLLESENVDYQWNKLEDIYDQFFMFKRQVVLGDICNAVETLFKNFKGSSDYNDAIGFLISSPYVDRSKKYDCGDAELELLLN